MAACLILECFRILGQHLLGEKNWPQKREINAVKSGHYFFLNSTGFPADGALLETFANPLVNLIRKVC